MFRRTLGLRRTCTALVSLTCGLVPLAVQAIDAPQKDMLFVASGVKGCGPGPAGEPFTIALEPRADTIKDAPFSGVGTTEVVTTLADGNRIVRTNTMRYYRDSAGRTRTEYSLAAIGPFTPDQAQTVVMITDPVEGRRYVLHSALKRADVFKLADMASAKASVASGVVSPGRVGNVATFTTRPAAGGAVSVTPGVAGAREAPEHGDGPVPPAPPVMVMSAGAALPPANMGFFAQYAPMTAQEGCKPNAKPLPAPTSLGEQIMEGLDVTGTRMEFTIAAGAVGNEQPIHISSEQWFSPELGVVVSSTHRDPMMGDTSYRLEQISRAEPDPSLFTVPADYTQTDVSQGVVFFKSVQTPEGGVAAGGIRLQPPPAPEQGK
jgi:hypothetical protein